MIVEFVTEPSTHKNKEDSDASEETLVCGLYYLLYHYISIYKETQRNFQMTKTNFQILY